MPSICSTAHFRPAFAPTHYDQDMRRLEHVSVVRPDDQVATIPNLSPCEISGSKRIEPASSGPTSHVFRTIPQLHLSNLSPSLTGSTARVRLRAERAGVVPVMYHGGDGSTRPRPFFPYRGGIRIIWCHSPSKPDHDGHAWLRPACSGSEEGRLVSGKLQKARWSSETTSTQPGVITKLSECWHGLTCRGRSGRREPWSQSRRA